MNKLEKLIDKAKFDYKYINPAFKFQPSKAGETELVHVGRSITTQELFGKYQFTSIEELVQYAIDNPDKQREFPIAIVWKDGDQFWFAILDRDGSRRGLDVNRDRPGDEWVDGCRFLVRKSLDTKSLGSSEALGLLAEIEDRTKRLKQLIEAA